MILGFKKQFVEKINNGTKIHTIREDKHDRWKVGREIQMATGVRSRNYNQFNHGICWAIQTIEITHLPGRVEVLVDGRFIGGSELDELARNDGFKGRFEFFEWFNSDFKGKIIHWTENFKY